LAPIPDVATVNSTEPPVITVDVEGDNVTVCPLAEMNPNRPKVVKNMIEVKSFILKKVKRVNGFTWTDWTSEFQKR
jgi:hypothetical protein